MKDPFEMNLETFSASQARYQGFYVMEVSSHSPNYPQPETRVNLQALFCRDTDGLLISTDETS